MHLRATSFILGGIALAVVACQGPNGGEGPHETLARPNIISSLAPPSRGPITVPIVSPPGAQDPARPQSQESPPPGGVGSPLPSAPLLPSPTPTPPTHLISVAGDGSPASQDGVATPGRLFEPVALWVENQHILVAEAGGHRVVAYREGPPSSLRAWAGSGLVGSQNGLGPQASFTRPAGLVAGAKGFYYLSDSAQGSLRELVVDGAGDITVRTLTGGGPQGRADGPVSEASFFAPQGLAYRDGMLYVADSGNHCIRRVDLNSKPVQVSTFVGSGAPGWVDGLAAGAAFNEPVALAWTPQGDLLVCDSGNHSVRVVAIAKGQAQNVRTLVGNGHRGGGEGEALGARLAEPMGLAMDPGGALYVADTGNHRVVRLAPEGQLSVLLGTEEAAFADGVGTAAALNAPSALAFGPDGRLWVADMGNHRLRVARP